MGFRVSRHGSNPGLPFSSWVTFGVLFNFSEGQFPPLEHGSHDLYLSGLGDACVEAPSIAPDPYCVLNLAQWFWKPRKPFLPWTNLFRISGIRAWEFVSEKESSSVSSMLQRLRLSNGKVLDWNFETSPLLPTMLQASFALLPLGLPQHLCKTRQTDLSEV